MIIIMQWKEEKPIGTGENRPSTEEMVAVCKYWYEEYGAIPAVIKEYAIEFRVPETVGYPRSLDVAKEQFAFSYGEGVDSNGNGNLSVKSSEIAKSVSWYIGWF